MKKPWIFMRGKVLPGLLVAMAAFVTGCPYNDYTVELKPHGSTIERTLTFCTIDGEVNGAPNYLGFDPKELALITNCYPTNSPTNNGGRYVIQGEFTNAMPADIGGAGMYTNLTTSLGAAGFYVERFRGNDDIAGMAEKHLQAAGQLTDVLIGWSQSELGREPGYKSLHQFMDVDFRRDMKNLSLYLAAGQIVANYKTNATEEFLVRFCQYLTDRGYFTPGEIAKTVEDGAFDAGGKQISHDVLGDIQRLVATKMGVPKNEPVPAALAFLGDEILLEKSFTNYIASTDAYRAKLKEWKKSKKSNADAKRPDPSDAVKDDIDGTLLDFNLFGDMPGRLAVRLSLPAAPLSSNGRWDADRKQEVWETNIQGRTNETAFPFACYANWVQADEAFQTAHFGVVALTGEDLVNYCLWRSVQDAKQGREWDDFLASLKPGPQLRESLGAFRFSGETNQVVTNDLNEIVYPFNDPRKLFKTILKGD